LTFNSYSSDTPGKRHAWHDNSFYDVLDIENQLRMNRERKAAERQEQIEQEKVRLRIAKVDQLYSKRVSIPGISEAMGISQEQVMEDLDVINRARSAEINAHTAAIQEQDEEELTDEEKDIRSEFLETGFVRPRNRWGEGAYVAVVF
jgi:hypothetical protein